MRRTLFIAFALLFLCSPALAQGTTAYPAGLDTGSTLPQAVDNKFAYLTAAVTSGATALPVNSTAGLPSTVLAQIDSELLSCSVTNATTLTCTRGFSGTAAAAHAIRATVRFPIGKDHINGIRGAALALEARVGIGPETADAAATGEVFTKKADGTTGYEPAAGESNTASNVGTAGVGVFKQKSGVDLQFKKLNAGSSRLTVTDDTGNSEVDLDVAEASLSRNSLGGGALTLANGGTGATDAATARSNLGLGTVATQAANNVSITGGSVTGIADLAVADGGTGASTAAAARTNLGAAASGANADITSLTATGLQVSSLAALTLTENTPLTLTANVNNYGLNTAVVQRVSSDASRVITGISTTSKCLILVNVGSFDVVLSNESISSAAANRIITGTGGALTLIPNGRATLWYDQTSQRWRVITP